ncbi:MAG: hypothetical protein C0501_16300 [Isosphaera sp.]|nr:hypothetical protein [Isosphaera sp.]
MSKVREKCGAVATARRPRAVVVGGARRGRVADRFRELGWEVTPVTAGAGLACGILSLVRKPAVVVLPVDTGWESGYLVAAKLRAARPGLRVILVAPARTPWTERFARFVGATLVAG